MMSGKCVNGQSTIANLSIPILSIILSQIFELTVYVFYPIEAQFYLFFIWVVFQVIGSVLVGMVSDLVGRRNVFILTQLFGMMGFVLIYFNGMQVWALCLVSLLYSPIPVARASLVDNFSHWNIRLLFSLTVIFQAIPWSFYRVIEDNISENIFLFLIISSFIALILSYIFFHDVTHDGSEKSPSIKDVKLNSFTKILIAFFLAETVYFLTAMTVDVNKSIDRGDLFFIIGISVSLGSAIHIFTKHWHPKTYNSVIASVYALGAILMFLLFLTSIFFKPNGLSVSFISIISCLGGLYIPFVFTYVIKKFHTQHRGLGCGITESVQGVSSIFAPLIFRILSGSVFLVEIALTLLYIFATVLSRSNKKDHV